MRKPASSPAVSFRSPAARVEPVGLTRKEVEDWAKRAGLSATNPRDHLALAAVLFERNEPVEAMSYRTVARWEESPPMSSNGWFLNLSFGFFTLEEASSESELFEARKGFLSALYSEVAGQPASLWEWESHAVPEMTWKRWVDPHQVEHLRALAPTPSTIPMPPRTL